MYTFIAKHGQKKALGFTIIEMVVVIGVISLLSSIVLVSLTNSRTRSRDARRITDIQSIQIALDLYYNDVGYFPYNIYGASGLSPKYIPRVPWNPSSTQACLLGSELSCYPYRALSGLAGIFNCNGSNLPIRYHLGAALETPGHKVLGTDADYQANPAYPACTNSGITGLGIDFNGLSTTCAVNGPAPDGCYDVTQ